MTWKTSKDRHAPWPAPKTLVQEIRRRLGFRMAQWASLSVAPIRWLHLRSVTAAEHFAMASLWPQDRARFTAWTNRRLGLKYPAARQAKLLAGEREVLPRYLPAAPARILLGGAGDGREAVHLLRWGYHVCAFDPVASFRPPGHPRLSWHTGSYEDLVAPQGPRAEAFRAWVFQQAPYDAVLLGLSSFSHIATDEIRKQLFSTLAQVCPRGRLILTYLVHQPRRIGRAATAIQALASLLSSAPTESADRVHLHEGYSRAGSLDVFAELVQAAGWRIIFRHGTLIPRHGLLVAQAAA